MSLSLRSRTFAEGHPIPVQHTDDGEDLSPPLDWMPPAGTVELALIVDDPDAPTPEPWVHWLLYKIAGDVTHLPGGFHDASIPADAPAGLVQGFNSWGSPGYRGPAPPRGHGVHHYHFKLYALDAALALPESLDKAALLDALSGHILARAELVGTYQR